MEPDDRRKKCFGCTSLRSGAIIIGAFDILLSTIAIVVSVVAMMNAQVHFALLNMRDQVLIILQGEVRIKRGDELECSFTM